MVPLTPLQIAFVGLAAIILLISLRVRIGVALGVVSFVGIWAIRGFDVAVTMLRTTPFEFAAHWSLSAIPMFLLMGAVAYHSRITEQIFRVSQLWLGGFPGGLAVAANWACAGFAAASGASIATAAAMGRITVPEMIRAGYDKGLATGVVASAGTLGIMIPPSIAMVLYGIFAEVSIAKLFIAGIFPGLLTATIYAAMIVIRCMIRPELAPRTTQVATWPERWQSVLDAWPLPVLVVGIICGLYSGLITATEAGAGGALLAIVIAFIQRRMTWRVLVDSVVEALTNTARIFFIAFAAVLLSRFLALSGLPQFLIDLIGSWATDPLMLVLLAAFIYIILGMFLDPIGLMLLTLPLFLPLFQAVGLDLIWIGVLVVKFIEIGLITPPVGMNVYVINSVTGKDVPLETIFRGVGWFLLCEVVVVSLLIAFPEISLFLTGFMD